MSFVIISNNSLLQAIKTKQTIIYSKSTMKTQGKLVNGVVLVFLLLILNIFLTFCTASIVDIKQINVIIYIIKPTSCLIRFTTSCGSCIYTESWKMFWCKGYRLGNWWRSKLMHCALIIMHFVLEYSIIYFVFCKDLTLSCNCFILAAIIFPKISSVDRTSCRRFFQR